jgi:structure-specific recognition protein 1
MVTPRGKYSLEFYQSFIKMHGKTYDYKLLNKNITRAVLLPKPDNLHVCFVIGLENAIRQGNTAYPFIVIEFNKDLEEVIQLNITREKSKEIFGEEAEVLDGALYDSVSRLFKALVKVNIIIPGTFRTKREDQAIKCSYKANAGFLYPLQKSFIFVTKPVIYIRFEEIRYIEFARADKTMNVRSFDLHVITRDSTYQFTSIDRDEYTALHSFLDKKRITIKNLEETDKFDPGEVEDDDEDFHSDSNDSN